MTPNRVLPAMVRLLEQGMKLDKHEASRLVFCDERTAARILCHLHVEGCVRICGWRAYGPGPKTMVVCKYDGKKDVPRPAPVSALEKTRKRRSDPAVREREAAIKRLNRAYAKQMAAPVRLGIWGL